MPRNLSFTVITYRFLGSTFLEMQIEPRLSHMLDVFTITELCPYLSELFVYFWRLLCSLCNNYFYKQYVLTSTNLYFCNSFLSHSQPCVLGEMDSIINSAAQMSHHISLSLRA